MRDFFSSKRVPALSDAYFLPMKIEVVESPDKALVDFFEKQIEAFNLAQWEIKERKPLAIRARMHGERAGLADLKVKPGSATPSEL